MTLTELDERIATLQSWADHCARWRTQLVDDLVVLHERAADYRGHRGWQTKGLIAATELAIRTLDKGTGELTETDAERADRDADNAAHCDVLNSLRLRHSGDGSYLVAFDSDGRELVPAELTPKQRTALERANRQHAMR
jgi:hypothetical protein